MAIIITKKRIHLYGHRFAMYDLKTNFLRLSPYTRQSVDGSKRIPLYGHRFAMYNLKTNFL